MASSSPRRTDSPLRAPGGGGDGRYGRPLKLDPALAPAFPYGSDAGAHPAYEYAGMAGPSEHGGPPWVLPAYGEDPAVKFGNPDLRHHLTSFLHTVMLPMDISDQAIFSQGGVLQLDYPSPHDQNELFLCPPDMVPTDAASESPELAMGVEWGDMNSVLPMEWLQELSTAPPGEQQSTGASAAGLSPAALAPGAPVAAVALDHSPREGARRGAVTLGSSPTPSASERGQHRRERKPMPAHMAAQWRRREIVREGFDIIRERLPFASGSLSRAAVLHKGAERVCLLQQDVETVRVRLEAARRKAAEEEAQRKSSSESNVDDISKSLRDFQIKAQPPIDEQLGKREEAPEETVRLHTDETIEDAYRRYQRDETDQTVLHLVLYVRNPDPNGPKRRGPESEDEGDDYLSEDGEDDPGVESIGAADTALNEPPGTEAAVATRPGKLPSAYAVNQKVVDALWERLSHEFDQSIGGSRFRSIDWQKGRVRSFLFGSGGNEERAYKMCQEHYTWLAQYRPHEITLNDIAHERATEKLRWLSHRTADGRWVLYFRVSLHHVAERNRKEAMQLWFHFIVDFFERRAGSPVASFVAVVDARELSRDNLDPAMFRKLMRLLCRSYPTILHHSYVVEPSWLFHYAHIILRPFVTHRFWDCMTLLKAPDWRQELRAVIGEANVKELDAFADQLSKHPS